MPHPTATFSKNISGFDPLSVPGCIFWVDATDPYGNGTIPTNTTQLSHIVDKITTFEGTAYLEMPIYYSSGINGRPAILFSDATAGGFYFNLDVDLATTNEITCFAVATATTALPNALGHDMRILSFSQNSGTGFTGNPNDYDNSSYLVGFTNTSGASDITTYRNNTTIASNAITQNLPFMAVNQYNGSNGYMWVNGTAATTTGTSSSGSFNLSAIGIGDSANGSGAYWNGYIGEILVFNRALTPGQRQQVEGYLAWKWKLETSASFLPTSVPTPLLWFDAADVTTMTLSGSNVTEWRDKVQGLAVTPSNGAYPPTQVGQSLYFNNVSDQIGATSVCLANTATTWTLPTESNTIFTVCAPDRLAATNELRCIFGLWTTGATSNLLIQSEIGSANMEGHYYQIDYTNGSSYNTYFIGNPYNLTLGTRRVDVLVGNKSNTKFYTNNIENTYVSATYSNRTPGTNFPVQRTIIASGAGNRVFSGYIYEILVYSGAVSDTQRQTIQGYLASKWNVTTIPTSLLPSVHPFYQLIPPTRQFAPIDISNCVVWLDGGDATTVTTSGTNVTGWTDKSGRGNSINSISATPPTYSQATGGVTFTCTSQNFLRGNLDSNYASNASVFVVAVLTSNASGIYNPRLLVLGSNTASDTNLIGQLNTTYNTNIGVAPKFSTYLGASGLTDNNPTGLQVNAMTYLTTTFGARTIYTNVSTWDGTSFSINTFLTGNTQTYSSRTDTATLNATYINSYNKYAIGGNPNTTAIAGDSFDGIIYEVVIYSRALSTYERQTIEGYLAWKWKLPVSQPDTAPFYRFPPTSSLGFTPRSISGSVLWLDAADSLTFNGSSIWTDKSGTGNHGINGTPPTTAVPSVTSWANGLKAARFVIASKNSIKTTNTIPNINVTYFIVTRIQAVSGSAILLINNVDGQRQITLSTSVFPATISAFANSGSSVSVLSASQGQGFLYCGTISPSVFTAYANGTSSGTGAVTTSSSSQNYFASESGATTFMSCDIGEILIYNRVVSTYERQTIEGYLAWKWALQNSLPSTHPYKKFPPSLF